MSEDQNQDSNENQVVEEENKEQTSEKEIFREKWLKEHVKPFKGQDFYEIRKRLLAADELFEDPEFVPSNDLLDEDSQKSTEKIRWLRPSKIVRRPKFVIDDFSRFDVSQGGAGDCWFVAALSALVEKKKFLNRVVCVDNSFDEDYAGIFHFRFWRFGEWVDVVIDDRLPVNDDRKLLYMNSKDNKEFWSALVEKAYAKFRGGYHVIDQGGWIELSFQNVSGGIVERYKLTDTPESAVRFFKTKLKKVAMIGCATLDELPEDIENELPSGHQYTITGALKYQKNYLIRIRNPWGNRHEWKGAWSDASAEWKSIPEDIKEQIGLKKAGDGEFWISYKDFVKYFEDISIVNLSPDENEAEEATKKWKKAQFKGEWVAGVTAGGPIENEETYYLNPQYLLTLDEPGNEDDDGLNSVVVALLQRESFPMKDFLNIEFNVFKFESNESDNYLDYDVVRDDPKPVGKELATWKPIFKQSNKEKRQEIHARLNLGAGKYLIVPSVDNADVEKEFLIRVYVDNKFKFEQYDKKVEKEEKRRSDSAKSAIEILFDEYAVDEKLNWKGLKKILENFLGVENSSKQLSRSIIAMMSKNYYRNIKLEKFKTLMDDLGKWKATFKAELDEDEETLKAQKLRDVLRSLGLNVDTNILNSLVFTYASDKALELDDFLMCVVKAKTLIEHFSDDEIKATDRWTMRTFL